MSAAQTSALVAVDGVAAGAIAAAARTAIKKVNGRARGGISRWDASGVFEELAMADEDAGKPSARTLLLLYAADLAFRLRWEIRPALDEGRTVVAAPYVDTAIAFGRAAGLQGGWLVNLFSFALTPSTRLFVEAARSSSEREKKGFVEFGRRWLAGASNGLGRDAIQERIAYHLRAAAKRRRCRIVRA